MKGDYYKGKYEVYVGNDAMNYITKDLSKYGVTRQELNDTFNRNAKYSEDNFYCIVLNNDRLIIN